MGRARSKREGECIGGERVWEGGWVEDEGVIGSSSRASVGSGGDDSAGANGLLADLIVDGDAVGRTRESKDGTKECAGGHGGGRGKEGEAKRDTDTLPSMFYVWSRGQGQVGGLRLGGRRLPSLGRA